MTVNLDDGNENKKFDLALPHSSNQASDFNQD